MRLRCSSRRKSEGFFQELNVSSEETEGFFRRALGLNTHIFPKRGAASLTGLHLRLSELRLCLPSRVNNRKAEQQRKGFRKRASFLKTRTVVVQHGYLDRGSASGASEYSWIMVHLSSFCKQ